LQKTVFGGINSDKLCEKLNSVPIFNKVISRKVQFLDKLTRMNLVKGQRDKVVLLKSMQEKYVTADVLKSTYKKYPTSI
jgi:hypothetical protein